MGCSQKGLGRATLAPTDMTAKAFLTPRMVLGARRLWVHSSASIGTLGDEPGLDEATNFVEFVRRKTGVTPGELRSTPSLELRQASIRAASGPGARKRRAGQDSSVKIWRGMGADSPHRVSKVSSAPDTSSDVAGRPNGADHDGPRRRGRALPA
jgi:AraC-like DNA-binding protein